MSNGVDERIRVADNPRMETGRRIREARKARGLTQTDLARLSGVPQSSLSDIENGGRRMFAERLLAIARALGVSIEDLCEG